MSYLENKSVTVTLSTLGAGNGNSTVINGLVQSAYVSISKAVGANSKVVITSTSTGRAILTVANPSTLGAYYYPRAQMVGSTGAVLGSSDGAMVPLVDERFRVNVTSSSGLNAQTATVTLTIV